MLIRFGRSITCCDERGLITAGIVCLQAVEPASCPAGEKARRVRGGVAHKAADDEKAASLAAADALHSERSCDTRHLKWVAPVPPCFISC